MARSVEIHAPASTSLLQTQQPSIPGPRRLRTADWEAPGMSRPTSTHLFCGGCGDLLAFQEAGFDPVFGANHEPTAIATLRTNFPGVRRLRCDINNLDFRRIPRSQVLAGSPICKEASPAGGNATPKQRPELEDAAGDDDQAPPPQWSRTRATAWDLIRAAEIHDYDVVCGENVVDFATRWNPFNAWLNVWDALGYNPQIASVNTAHLSGPDNEAAPQHRQRILFVFTKKGLPLPDLQVRPDSWCPECGPVQGSRSGASGSTSPGYARSAGTANSTGTCAPPCGAIGRSSR